MKSHTKLLIYITVSYSHLPIYLVFISLQGVVDGRAHARRHGVAVGCVRVLV